jgi:hypothetical protein
MDKSQIIIPVMAAYHLQKLSKKLNIFLNAYLFFRKESLIINLYDIKKHLILGIFPRLFVRRISIYILHLPVGGIGIYSSLVLSGLLLSQNNESNTSFYTSKTNLSYINKTNSDPKETLLKMTFVTNILTCPSCKNKNFVSLNYNLKIFFEICTQGY